MKKVFFRIRVTALQSNLQSLTNPLNGSGKGGTSEKSNRVSYSYLQLLTPLPVTLLLVLAIIMLTACSKSGSDANGTPPPPPPTPTTTAPTVTTEAVTQSSSYEYQSSAKITNTGGLSITEQGVCWSTGSNPSKADNIIVAPASTFPRLTALVTYHVRAFATNSKGTAYGNEITFTPKIDLGMIYAGGIVFFVDAAFTHGLCAAPADQGAKITWAPGSLWTTSVATNTSNGAANTTAIITAYGNAGSYAAKLCRDYRGENYTDWYLPASKEIYWLKTNQKFVPGFPTTGEIGVAFNYWSSTQTNSFNAECYEFTPDNIYFLNSEEQKNRQFSVRAIRSF